MHQEIKVFREINNNYIQEFVSLFSVIRAWSIKECYHQYLQSLRLFISWRVGSSRQFFIHWFLTDKVTWRAFTLESENNDLSILLMRPFRSINIPSSLCLWVRSLATLPRQSEKWTDTRRVKIMVMMQLKQTNWSQSAERRTWINLLNKSRLRWKVNTRGNWPI